jgi:hypothetical protein
MIEITAHPILLLKDLILMVLVIHPTLNLLICEIFYHIEYQIFEPRKDYSTKFLYDFLSHLYLFLNSYSIL